MRGMPAGKGQMQATRQSREGTMKLPSARGKKKIREDLPQHPCVP